MSRHGNNAEVEPLLGSATSGSIQAHKPGHQAQHTVYGRRWLILGIVALLQLSNAMQWVTYAPVAQYASTYYETSCETIDGLSLTFMAVSIPGTFVSAWTFRRFGLRRGLVLSAALNAMGASVRCLGNLWGVDPHEKLLWQFVGQCLSAAAQPFALGCTTLLAQTWFPEDERAIANSLSSLANPIGIAVGSAVVPIVTTDETEVPLALMVTLVPSLVTFFVAFVGMQAKPPTPPSTSAEEHEYDSFSEGLRKLATTKQYWLLFLAFGVGVGVFNAVATLMSQILVGQGYSPEDAGRTSAVLIGAGIFGAAGSGVLLDHTHAFLAILKSSFVLATAAFALFAWFNRPGQLDEIMAVTAVVGVFCFALLPVALELGVEITYPVSEATSSGFLWLSGQAFGIAFVLAMNALKGRWLVHSPEAFGPDTKNATGCTGHGPPKTMEGACWFMVGAAVLATVFALPLYTRYRRHELEVEATEEDARMKAEAAAGGAAAALTSAS